MERWSKLKGRVDVEIANRHPSEIPLNERRRVVLSEHRDKNGHGQRKGQQEHRGADEAHRTSKPMAYHRMFLVMSSMAMPSVGGDPGSVLPVTVRQPRIARPGAVRRHDGEESVQYKPKQWQCGDDPQPLRHRAVERMRGVDRRLRKEHQPLSTLMDCRFTVCRCRNSAMMIANPTAASAAATEIITRRTRRSAPPRHRSARKR